MKKLIAILAVLMGLTIILPLSSNAQTVDYSVSLSFLQDFPGATNVNWRSTDDYFFVSFDINGNSLNSFYNKRGELIGTYHTIAKEQLPISIQLNIQKKFPGYTYKSDIIEINYENSTNYIIYIENEKYIIKLNSTGGSDLNIDKKTRK